MKNEKGYITLIEIIMIGAILGILAALVIPQYAMYRSYSQAKEMGLTVADSASEWKKTLSKEAKEALRKGKEILEIMKANKSEPGKIYLVVTDSGSYVVKSGYRIEAGNVIAKNRATNKEIIISPPYTIQEWEEEIMVEFTAEPVTPVVEKEKKIEWGDSW